jgi:type I restriction enzyme S subunit
VRELPNKWKWLTLGDIAKWSSGGTPKAGTASYYDGHIPWAIIGDLSDGPLTHTRSSISEHGLLNSSAKWVPSGSLLIAMYGSIGKLGRTVHEVTTNQAIAAAIPGPDVKLMYLFYYLLSQRAALAAAGKGATQKNISQTVLKQWPIPVAPLDEQTRIVAEIENHLMTLDSAIKTVKTNRVRMEALRRQLIQAAITGQNSSEERKPWDSTDVHDGNLPDIPLSWSPARLGDIAEVVGGVTKDAKKQSTPGYITRPYLRVANVQRGRLDLQKITEIKVAEKQAVQLELQPGDVLLNEGGDRDKLARGWVWEGQIPHCIHQNHVFRARIRDGVLDPYFLSFLTNSLGGAWAERNGKQSVNLASISLSKIKQMPVVVPPFEESQRIARELMGQLANLNRLDQTLESALNRADNLRRSILTTAFEGRLTERYLLAAIDPDMPSPDTLNMTLEAL